MRTYGIQWEWIFFCGGIVLGEFFLPQTDERFRLLGEKMARHRALLGERCVFVFPFNAVAEKMKSDLQKARAGDVCALGNCPPPLRPFLTEKGIVLVEFLQNEAYRRRNALATAQGALAEVIRREKGLLQEKTVLVCGYGACGAPLAKLFYLLGCEVFVYSHPASAARAEKDGFSFFPLASPRLAMFDFVLNTVPAPVFPKEVLCALRPGTAFYQIATGTSGVDVALLAARGVAFYPLWGLPGAYCPESEAETMEKILLETLGKVRNS